MVPSNPAAFQASFTALTLPWGLPWRNSFKKLVLPGVAVAVLGILGADFPLAAVLEFPRRLPVRFIFTFVLLTNVGLIVPSYPAACHASFTALVLAWGLPWRNSLTKLVLPGAAVAVVAIVESPGWCKLRPVSTGDWRQAYATWSTKFTRTSRESRVFGWLTVSRRKYSIGYAGGIFSWLQ